MAAEAPLTILMYSQADTPPGGEIRRKVKNNFETENIICAIIVMMTP